MKKSKSIVLAFCALLLVTATIMITIAYLTDSSTVVNTFTIGKVDLTLDEAVVDKDGTPTGERTEKGNNYHLLPGITYTKDPTVTVTKGSEESYVRMLLTLTHSSQLDAIFTPSNTILNEFFNGYDSTTWIYSGETKDTANNTITYEFRYKDKVKAVDSDLPLDALFDSITVPGSLTGEQLETIAGLEITVEAHAIQATGFTDSNAAWATFTK